MRRSLLLSEGALPQESARRTQNKAAATSWAKLSEEHFRWARLTAWVGEEADRSRGVQKLLRALPLSGYRRPIREEV